MLTPYDDLLVHQTSEPVAHPATGDPNAYDRYFFNGYSPDGELFFAAALGLYPNRQVMDAAFSVVRRGRQHSVIASRRAPLDRSATVGPITVEVVEPLHRLRVVVDAADHGLGADLTFTSRTAALEEPHYTRRVQSRLSMDYTRLTQLGTWDGTVDVDGERGQVEAVVGSRDRSWGIRPVGERATGGVPAPLPQFFWLWAPLHFDDFCVQFDVNEEADGRQWHSYGAIAPSGGGAPEVATAVSHRVEWQPGTRRARHAEIVLQRHEHPPMTIALEPVLTFQMLGLGYLHPEWGHGVWKGEEAVHADAWDLDGVEPLDPRWLHVQQLVRADADGQQGVGVFEQLVIGPHAPSGFVDILDGAK